MVKITDCSKKEGTGSHSEVKKNKQTNKTTELVNQVTAVHHVISVILVQYHILN